MTNIANIEIFKNEEFGSVRVVVIDNDPWFVGRDVAAALGYANTKDALGKHVEAEDKQIIQRSQNATFEIPVRGLTIINESGLYSLMLMSKLPSAKRFKHWITSEVLPSLRANGIYITDPLLQQFARDPDFAHAVVARSMSSRSASTSLCRKHTTSTPLLTPGTPCLSASPQSSSACPSTGSCGCSSAAGCSTAATGGSCRMRTSASAGCSRSRSAARW